MVVYDYPTRIFHWSFAIFFLSAFLIGKILDDEDPRFPFHMLAGLTVSALVIFRIFWGFAGSKYARFSSFILKPRELISYMKGVVSGQKRTWAGHNPASSWAALLLLALGLGLGTTGYLMASGWGGDILEEIHELLGNGFIVVAGFHVLGVVYHTIRLKDPIGLSMVDGRKSDAKGDEGIVKSYPVVGLILAAVVIGYAGYLYKNFDPAKGQLKLFGNVLQLSEESEDHGEQKDHEIHEDHEE